MDLSAFEIITELPREITTEEIIGRRIFVKINSFIPKAQTIGEVVDWTNYSIQLPKTIKLSFESYQAEKIHYRINHINNTLHISVDIDASSIEARNFIQHVMNEAKNGKRKV